MPREAVIFAIFKLTDRHWALREILSKIAVANKILTFVCYNTVKIKSGLIRALGHYFTFFLLVAFVITCCMTLFLNLLSQNLGIPFSGDNISLAAKVTFWNVILISLLFTVIDTVRRKLTVDRPVARISEAAEQMIHGDFDVHPPRSSSLISDGKFNEIIECFNHMAKELSGVETLRCDFIANVSHEMKTPLSIIQSYGCLLQAPELPEDKRMEYALAITDASRRLAEELMK